MLRRTALTAALTAAFTLQGVHPAGATTAFPARQVDQAVAWYAHKVARTYRVRCHIGRHSANCALTEYDVPGFLEQDDGSYLRGTIGEHIHLVRRGCRIRITSGLFQGTSSYAIPRCR